MTGKRWVVFTIRVFLAAAFIFYGYAKLVGMQFGVGPSIGEGRLRDTSPYLITWYFFSLSPLYHNAIGLAQITTGLLLIPPRTAPAGALCFFAIILNIVLINFGYNIATDVKILSSTLLALDCCLIRHYWRRYRLLFLSEASLAELLAPRSRGRGGVPERKADGA